MRAALYYRVPTDAPVAFITIDDGYATDPLATAYVQEHTLPVTQFLTFYAATSGSFPPLSAGELAHIDELRKYQTGTTSQKRIGCHQKEHHDYRGQTVAEQQTAMANAADWLGDLFGSRPRLFRPPYGCYDLNTLQAANNAAMSKVVLWTHVWQNNQLENEWGSPRLRNGDVILLHHPSQPDMDGYLLEQIQAALDAIVGANLVPAYLHDFL